MKGNLSSGSGNNDLQKSGVSNQQDIGNAMFSSNIFRQQFFDSKWNIFSFMVLSNKQNLLINDKMLSINTHVLQFPAWKLKITINDPFILPENYI